MLSKNVNNKKCAPKLIFFNEQEIEKDLNNFLRRKLTLIAPVQLVNIHYKPAYNSFNSYI